MTHVVVSWAWAKQEIELADLCLKGGMLEAEAAITGELTS